MMNKRKSFAFGLMLVLVISVICLAACGGRDAQEQDEVPEEAAPPGAAQEQETSEVADEGQTAGESPATDQEALGDYEGIDISTLGGDGVDVDLTKLSSVMVYSVVNDILVRPREYVGKKIRMAGTLASYYDEEKDKTYYACFIQDATACCAQGIEFSTTDDFSPEDYPGEGEALTVSGVFELYNEGEFMYCRLRDAVLE